LRRYDRCRIRDLETVRDQMEEASEDGGLSGGFRPWEGRTNPLHSNCFVASAPIGPDGQWKQQINGKIMKEGKIREDCCLLGCDTVWSGRGVSTFRRYLREISGIAEEPLAFEGLCSVQLVS
jgi:hypothetical protein